MSSIGNIQTAIRKRNCECRKLILEEERRRLKACENFCFYQLIHYQKCIPDCMKDCMKDKDK